jgi:catechol 2,3-dioxygenase-like lactoylglutathione lyase family enzyme
VPVLFVADLYRSAEFYGQTLGFTLNFLHGDPPFYGSVSRDSAQLHLKWIHDPVFVHGRIDAEGLIMAFLPVDDLEALYAEYCAAGAPLKQKLTKHAWGGTDFHIADPDGNVLAFAG